MNIASFIDHTILKVDTTSAQIQQLCAEAKEAGFAAVCVPPVYVREAAGLLKDSGVAVATVIGFPAGYHLPAVKAAETEMAILSGADELDLVINIAALKNGDWRMLETEIREVLEVVKLSAKKLKVIIETALLTDEELQRACELYGRFNIDWLKTSSGFNGGGATVEAVRKMRALLPPHIQIKASGGIRDFETAKAMIDAGATRLGTSASLQILAESRG